MARVDESSELYYTQILANSFQSVFGSEVGIGVPMYKFSCDILEYKTDGRLVSYEVKRLRKNSDKDRIRREIYLAMGQLCCYSSRINRDVIKKIILIDPDYSEEREKLNKFFFDYITYELNFHILYTSPLGIEEMRWEKGYEEKPFIHSLKRFIKNKPEYLLNNH